MKNTSRLVRTLLTGILGFITAIGITAATPRAFASGGGSGGGGGGTTSSVDTIKVQKCYDAPVGGYVELLLQAVSSDSNAHLYAYLPDGTYLGEVQNGGGGRYGGTVFGSYYIPATITFISSSGGSITVPTSPMQL